VHQLELILLAIYGVLGPNLWGVYCWTMKLGRRRLTLMKKSPIKDEPPGVTILIPAKDEGERIRACVLSALDQDYPHFDVIGIDDRSTDNTGAVMDEIAGAHPKMSVLHITEPPGPGWTGKNNALHQGTKRATGKWILLVDSDVVLKPDALTTAMSVVLRKEFDMLSLLPRIESHSFWEGLLIPMAGAAASTMYLIALNNSNDFPKTAFANGQFMLMSRAAYDKIGGHEAVKDRYCEDVAISRVMKGRGMRPRVSWGNDYCSVRMYDSLGAIIRGWSRIYYAARVGSPWRILAALFFVMVCAMSVYPALAWGIYRTIHPVAEWPGLIGHLAHHYLGAVWLFNSILHFALLNVALRRVYKWSGNTAKYAVLFPLAGPMLSYIFYRALKMCVTKKVEWRGTAYSHVMQTIPHERGAEAGVGVSPSTAERSRSQPAA
jgi:cellulose synthase/poly-beta-1,6-N-acetylglucosamine synthase-like glycosyltransferase